MDIAFHVNTTQAHQREHGEWLRAGFKRHGINISVTSDINQNADIHIVSGPHHAKTRWQGHKTIWLDRAYYHEEKTGKWASMDWVSLGWLRADGGREFKKGEGRPRIEKAERPNSEKTIFLADYRGKIETADTVRLHPGEKREPEPLRKALRRHGTAIGYDSTALVIAGLEGLDIVCKSPRSIMNDNWIELLPYADWHYSEICSGEAIEHLWL